ncbi:MAG: hypothetical protein BWK78_08565, partial [Thiotrichaceae bacterium IS1]
GVLLHITSLPPTRSGDLLLGDLGEQAYRFVSLLNSWGMSVWQVLPIHPLYSLDDLSPYQPQSVHAGNPWLISQGCF